MKNLLLLLSCLAAIQVFAQEPTTGLPVDPVTGKVRYTGTIELPGQNADEILDKLQMWLSYFHQFRGSFGPAHVIDDLRFLHCSVQINVTPNARTRVWWVNASLKVNADNGSMNYTITDFYTFTTTMVIPQITTPYEGPIEEMDYFKYRDPDGLTDNVRNLNNQIDRIIRAMSDFLSAGQ